MPPRRNKGSTSDPKWLPDPELDSFEICTLQLLGLPSLEEEPGDELVATLIRQRAPVSSKALLYVHGWDDYFFQSHLAAEIAEAGYDFYAIDLHRYGRSLRPGQLPGYCSDLAEYDQELLEAVLMIRNEGHDRIVLMGHSTGGLIAALWADAHPGVVDGLALNSPWLESRGYPALRQAVQLMVSAASQVSPTTALPVRDLGFYRRSISDTEDGIWSYNLDLKGDKQFAVRLGWLGAVTTGHRKVASGLNIDVPVFMAASASSETGIRWNENMHRADIVLDVDLLASKAHLLGVLVTLVRVRGGKHDLALSDEGPRRNYFRELRRWLAAYV